MSVIATMEFAAEDFELGRLFETAPVETVEIEATVPISDSVLPYVWIEAADPDPTVRALGEASSVETVTVREALPPRYLLEITWAADCDELIRDLCRADAVVLRASRTGDTWQFQCRFPDYDDLSAFNRACRDRDVAVDLAELHQPTGPSGDSRYGLSAEQREILVRAAAAGYFEVPRGATLDVLGEDLGISDTAASQRLRRGLATLLEETLLAEQDAG